MPGDLSGCLTLLNDEANGLTHRIVRKLLTIRFIESNDIDSLGRQKYFSHALKRVPTSSASRTRHTASSQQRVLCISVGIMAM